MKYKQRIISGAFALTLLVGGSSSVRAYAHAEGARGDVFATSARSGALSVKNQKNLRTKINHTVGVVTAVSGSGFTFEVHHKQHVSSTVPVEKVLSIDVQTTPATTIKKDGLNATFIDLAIGQKVIVTGQIHAADLIVNATKVDIVTKPLAVLDKRKGKFRK